MNVAGGYDRRRGKWQVSVIARTLRVQSLSELVPHVVLIGPTVWVVVGGIATGLPLGIAERRCLSCAAILAAFISSYWRRGAVCLALCEALSPDHVVCAWLCVRLFRLIMSFVPGFV